MQARTQLCTQAQTPPTPGAAHPTTTQNRTQHPAVPSTPPAGAPLLQALVVLFLALDLVLQLHNAPLAPSHLQQ